MLGPPRYCPRRSHLPPGRLRYRGHPGGHPGSRPAFRPRRTAGTRTLRRTTLAEQLTIALALRISDDTVSRIESLSPGIRVISLAEAAGRNTPDEATRQRMIEAMAEVDVLVATSFLDAAYIEAAPKLRWWQVTNAGVDRLVADGLLHRGLAVTNVSGVSAPPM